MDYKKDENNNLVLTIDETERQFLADLKADDPDRFDTDAFMHDYFEGFIGNSEFAWMQPEYIGALTSAPILGIYGEPRSLKAGENADFMRLVGCWEDENGILKTWVEDPIEAYGFMDYMLESLQGRLLETGKAVLINSLE